MPVTTIRSGSLEAGVSSKGAQLTSLVLNGNEYLWQGDPRWWKGQAPVLFPIVGTLREGRAQSAQGEVRLGRHGLARDYEHELIEATENRVTYELRSNYETRERYPYDFALRMTYSVDGESLSQTFEIENTGSVELPFVVGGHPAFNVPPARTDGTPAFEERYDEYVVRFAERWDWWCPAMDGTTGLIDWMSIRPIVVCNDTLHVSHGLFARDALVFEDVPERTVTLEGPAGHGVRVDFQGFNFLGIWSAAGDSPFVAIEPWTGIATCTDEGDVFEQKRGMKLLAPGETSRLTFTITPF